MVDVLIKVPPRVLGQVQRAIAALHRWNNTVRQVRRAEAVAGDHGRHEHDLRYSASGATHRASLAQAETLLARFEGLAVQNHVDPQAVYTALGGRPALVEEGPQVQEWRPHGA